MTDQAYKQKALIVGTVSDELVKGLLDRGFDARRSESLDPMHIGQEAWDENRVVIVDSQQLGWMIFQNCRSPRVLKLDDFQDEELVTAAAQMLSSSQLSQYNAFVNLKAAPSH